MAESSGTLVTNNTDTQKQCSAVQGEEDTGDQKTEKVMEPMLLEDYETDREPRTLTNLLEAIRTSEPIAPPPTANDLLSGLVYLLMVESGFVPVGSYGPEEGCCFSYRRLLELSRSLPARWKTHGYDLVLQPFEEHACRVSCCVATAAQAQADSSVVECVVSGVCASESSFSVTLDHQTYVAAFSSDDARITFRHLRRLSRVVKDQVGFPAKCAILRRTGGRLACLEHLPDEVLLRILERLDMNDLLKLGRCSARLKVVCQDLKLRNTLLVDFITQSWSNLQAWSRVLGKRSYAKDK